MIQLSHQNIRDIKATLLTIVLYLPLLFWWHSSSYGLADTKHDKSITIKLQTFKCKEEITPQEIIVDEPIQEDTKETPTSIEEPVIEPIVDEIIKEPIVEDIAPLPTPQPISEKPKPIVKKKKKLKTKKRKQKKAKKSKIKKKTKKRKSSTYKKSSKSSSKKKNIFLATLKSRINKNKRYPRIAQKRGIQGSVKVHFTVTSSTKVSNIKVKGSKVFISATKKAIKKAFPIDTKGVSLPINVSFILNYKLR